jgi:hypothetical protein
MISPAQALRRQSMSPHMQRPAAVAASRAAAPLAEVQPAAALRIMGTAIPAAVYQTAAEVAASSARAPELLTM